MTELIQQAEARYCLLLDLNSPAWGPAAGLGACFEEPQGTCTEHNIVYGFAVGRCHGTPLAISLFPAGKHSYRSHLIPGHLRAVHVLL